MDEVNEEYETLSSKSTSSLSNSDALSNYKFHVKSLDAIVKSQASDEYKNEMIKKTMHKKKVYEDMRKQQKLSDLSSSGHTRVHKSVDETYAKPIGKGIPRDTTAPNLGAHLRPDMMEEEARPPLGYDGTYDKVSDLEVPVGGGIQTSTGEGLESVPMGEGIEPVREDSHKPQAAKSSTSKKVSNPGFNSASSPPSKKWDKIKNWIKNINNKD